MEEFTAEQLSEYNGKNGKPVYVAYWGSVYDVSDSRLWKGGLHMRRHQAGTDLTADLQAAPHAEEVFERYPQVGVLKREAPVENALPNIVKWLLDTNPWFRRHPHPMTVHFPIVFMLSNPFFNLLYLITGEKAFEITALHCLAGGILFLLVAMATGLLTWWYNYMGKMLKPVAVKIPLSIIILVEAVIVFIWRIKDPHVLDRLNGGGIIYLILVLSFFPLTAVIGWYGASMTFPIEKE